MKELPFEIELEAGDWSNDGHGQSESFRIHSSLNGKDLEKAYKKGVKKLGFDFREKVCREWQDNTLQRIHLNKFRELGFGIGFEGDEQGRAEDEDCCILDVEDYLKMYLFVVWLGNEKFRYVMNKPSKDNWIAIGGYGLFDHG